MNTHDIELPPLVGTLADLPERHKEVIEAYGQACARAAIKADRQRLKLELEKWYEEAAVEYQKTGDPYYDGKEDAFDLAIQIVDGRKK